MRTKVDCFKCPVADACREMNLTMELDGVKLPVCPILLAISVKLSVKHRGRVEMAKVLEKPFLAEKVLVAS